MGDPRDVPNVLDRKVDVCFRHCDMDGDGVMEAVDRRVLAEKIVTALGQSVDSPRAQEFLDAFDACTEFLLDEMDLDFDGRITPDEYRVGFQRGLGPGTPGFEDGLVAVAKALWRMCDVNNDGQVEFPEFSACQRAFGTSEADTRLAFQKLDRDNDGRIPVVELTQAWIEYHTSTDPKAPGNWLFGDIWHTRQSALV